MAFSSSSPFLLFVFAMLVLSVYSETECPRREDYSWAKDTNFRICSAKCASNCMSLNIEVRWLGCDDYSTIKTAICYSCCTPNTPSPPPPSPSPPPPSPSPSSPPPTPSGDTCNKPGDLYSEITSATSDCSWCKGWCRDDCLEQGAEMVSNKCSIGASKYVTDCKCCCHEKPQPPPPPPPSETPTVDACNKPGDIFSQITNPTSDCSWCEAWCQNDCSEQGGEMVDNKCSIGASKYVTDCKCCCQEKPQPPPPPPSPPSVDTCDKDNYSETIYATSNCADCDVWCKKDVCLKQGAEVASQKCSIPGQSQWLRRCQCCCDKPSPPPSPTPTKNTCDKTEDIYTEKTHPSPDCNYCTKWCNDDCSELGGNVVSNQCVLGKSDASCMCCCKESSGLKVNVAKAIVRPTSAVL